MVSPKLIPDALDLIPYRYGLDTIPADITKQELLYYFSLTDDKKAFIERHCRLSPSRIALAIQLGAYGFIGRPQEKPEEAPSIVIRFLAEALKLQGEFIPLEYSNRSMTRWDHDNMARQFLGLSLFSPQQHDILIDYLTQLCPDPGNYFEWIKKAEDFLREKQFVLPTMNVLRRLVASARHQSLERVFNQIYNQLGDERINNLERLLGNDDEVRSKWFGLTNKNVYSATTTKVSEVLNRIKEIREFSLHEIDVTTLPDQYLRHLAYQGIRLSSKQLKKCSPLHRYATMAIALRTLESEYIDIAIQMNDEILAGVFLRGKQRLEIYLKKHRKTVEQVLYAFNVMSDAMLDEAMNPVEKFEHISQEFPSDKMRTLREPNRSIAYTARIRGGLLCQWRPSDYSKISSSTAGNHSYCLSFQTRSIGRSS